MPNRVSLGTENRIFFMCPGCKEVHSITSGPWSWNNDREYPTFLPSVLVRGNQWPKDEYPEYYRPEHAKVAPGEDTVCHSFVTQGEIQFLSDSTHSLAGTTVDIPEWPYDKDPE